jgi:N-acetyl-anhydromuramyl-L-alanine amidase AmpD
MKKIKFKIGVIAIVIVLLAVSSYVVLGVTGPSAVNPATGIYPAFEERAGDDTLLRSNGLWVILNDGSYGWLTLVDGNFQEEPGVSIGLFRAWDEFSDAEILLLNLPYVQDPSSTGLIFYQNYGVDRIAEVYSVSVPGPLQEAVGESALAVAYPDPIPSSSSSTSLALTATPSSPYSSPQLDCDKESDCNDVDAIWNLISGFVDATLSGKVWRPEESLSGVWQQSNLGYSSPGQVSDAKGDDTVPSVATDCSYLTSRVVGLNQGTNMPYSDLTVTDYRNSFCSETNGVEKFRFNKVNTRQINEVVLHYTAGSTIVSALNAWQGDHPASAHYIVGRDGSIYYVVDEKDIAWHAGCKSNDPLCVRDTGNIHSIGIEIVNRGYECSSPLDCEDHGGRQWEKYPPAQLQSLYKLTGYLASKYEIPVDKDHFVGHNEIFSGKVDPGPAFNWDLFLEKTSEQVGLITPSQPIS